MKGQDWRLWGCLTAFLLIAVSMRAAETGPWARVVIIGASVSHGFTFDEPFGGGPRTKELALERFFDAAIIAPHTPVKNLANSMFFLIPDDSGHAQIRQALTNNPTLVIGGDFLFWFCYGDGLTDQQRAEHFEKGLKMLEEIKCPLVVGDIPDVSAARNRALKPSEFPSERARAAANRRLAEWAVQHKEVTVVPATKFMSAIAANETWTVHGFSIPQGKTRGLLQPDRLHPSQRGNAVLALSILDAFLTAHPSLDASGVRWDPNEVFKIGARFSN